MDMATMLYYDNVVSVAFEAVLVVDNHRADRLERVHNNPGDLVEEAIGDLFAARALQVQLEVLDGPFAAVYGVVVVALLLIGHVGQVHEHVVDVVGGRRVLDRAEASKAEPIPVALERPVRRDEYVDAQVELLAAN